MYHHCHRPDPLKCCIFCLLLLLQDFDCTDIVSLIDCFTVVMFRSVILKCQVVIELYCIVLYCIVLLCTGRSNRIYLWVSNMMTMVLKTYAEYSTEARSCKRYDVLIVVAEIVSHFLSVIVIERLVLYVNDMCFRSAFSLLQCNTNNSHTIEGLQ